MRISPPSITIPESIDGFEERQARLLEATAGTDLSDDEICDPKKDLYGNRAIANLILGRHIDACNRSLIHVAEWFDHPHPNGRHHAGECDFAAMKLCRASHLFAPSDILSPETRQRIQRFFLTTDFKSRHSSENHELLWRTSRYLMGRFYPDETFEPYDRTGAALAEEDSDWITSFIRYRGRRAWGEFDSSCYFIPDWECLISLHDFCSSAPAPIPDPELPDMVKQIMNVLLLDMIVDSRHGLYGGAHGRIYEPHAIDHRSTGTYALQYLYFGNADPDPIPGGILVDAVSSDFRPDEIVIDIALNRSYPYLNLERKHLHNCSDVRPVSPVDGSIRKYTYVDTDFVIGAVQHQDPYPEDCSGAWYARHEQHEWDLTFTARTDARIFTHHPGEAGPEHGYWTGDIRCCCGHFFQIKTAVLALYDIPEDQPHAFIHAWIPRHAFDEVIEEAGWVFVRLGEAYGAIRLMETQEWVTEGDYADRELISRGRRNGAICEAGSLDSCGSFETFRTGIVANAFTYDRDALTLSYTSRKAGSLYLDTAGTRRVDGVDIDLDYALYDCPYLNSEWDSGQVVAAMKSETHTYSFI